MEQLLNELLTWNALIKFGGWAVPVILLGVWCYKDENKSRV